MQEVVDAHSAEYGVKPDVIATAPGRFHLAGEHTWFFRDKTLSMAVNLPVYVAVSLRDDSNYKFLFHQLGESKKSSPTTLKFKKEDKWANAVKSVLYGFVSCGFNLKGMDFTIYSDILPSAGFGITTAIKVATAWAVRECCRIRCNQDNLLTVLDRANRIYYASDNHKADSFACIYSKENSLVLTDYSTNTAELIPFKFKKKTILLTDAKVPRIVTWNEESLMQPEHVLLLGELKERKANVYGGWKYEENPSEVNEVLSVVNEDTKRRLSCIMNEHRVILDSVASLQKSEFSGFAYAVNKSHEYMRDQYDISCPEIDWILKRVHEFDENADNLRAPEHCGRITGKGFGRCVYTILDTDDVPKFYEKLEEYEHIFGFKADAYEVKPAKGVHLL